MTAQLPGTELLVTVHYESGELLAFDGGGFVQGLDRGRRR